MYASMQSVHTPLQVPQVRIQYTVYTFKKGPFSYIIKNGLFQVTTELDYYRTKKFVFKVEIKAIYTSHLFNFRDRS